MKHKSTCYITKIVLLIVFNKKFRDCCIGKATYTSRSLFFVRVVTCLVPFLPNLRLDFDEDPTFKHLDIPVEKPESINERAFKMAYTKCSHRSTKSNRKSRKTIFLFISNFDKNHWRVYEKQSNDVKLQIIK